MTEKASARLMSSHFTKDDSSVPRREADVWPFLICVLTCPAMLFGEAVGPGFRFRRCVYAAPRGFEVLNYQPFCLRNDVMCATWCLPCQA